MRQQWRYSEEVVEDNLKKASSECPNCGAGADPGVNRCPSCGYSTAKHPSLLLPILLFVLCGLPSGAIGTCSYINAINFDPRTSGLPFKEIFFTTALLAFLIFAGLLVLLIKRIRR